MNRTVMTALAALLALQAVAAPPKAGKEQRDHAIYREDPLLDRERKEEDERDRLRAEQKGEPWKPGAAKPAPRRLSLDLSTLVRPHDPKEFKQAWHFPPVRQWWTNTCWSYSTTSFLESELKRLHGKEIKLSEMYTVYWEYVEKVKAFVRTKGTSLVAEGSEANAVLARWRTYGVVPYEAYSGLKPGRAMQDHEQLIDDISAYLDFVKKGQDWDEASVVAHLRVILDRHMGRPPETVTVEGRQLTPQQYLKEVVRLDPDDYVEFMSTLRAPFWTLAEYEYPDNWWHSKDYRNIPLEDWYQGLREAAAAGYSVCIGGDVSEPGMVGAEDLGIVPSYDIPASHIDQDSREMRIANRATDDDHGIHIVGFLHRDGHDWFLVKDSGRAAQRGVPGYYFYRDDYVRLKMLSFLVHKSAVKGLLEKFERGGKK